MKSFVLELREKVLFYETKSGYDMSIIFLVEYGTKACLIIRVFTLLFALSAYIHFQIAVVIPHYF